MNGDGRLSWRGYSRRMRAYLSEMFPVGGAFALAVLIYLAVALFVADAGGLPIPLVSWFTVLGIWSVFGPFLILRLMDELKDRDIDAALFPDRPLPSGRVAARDIGVTLAAACVLFLSANAVSARTFAAAAVVLGWAFLMFVRFFMPQTLRASLLLTLATHNPIVPLSILHVVVIACVAGERRFVDLPWRLVAPFVVMAWLPMLAWELSRKIRSAAEETSYVTYSQSLGRVGAVAATAGIQGLSVGIGLYLFLRMNLSWVYVALLAASYAAALWALGRFLLWPDARTSKLRPYGELFVFGMFTAQVVEFGWRSLVHGTVG